LQGDRAGVLVRSGADSGPHQVAAVIGLDRGGGHGDLLVVKELL
jgi:hypothetical protein